MNASLEGRAAFISGAGHGIGRATALEMARLGAIVGVNDLKPEFVEDTVAEIRRLGGKAVSLPQDVSTREGMRESVLRFAREAGRLDVMVNNAAWMPQITDLKPISTMRSMTSGVISARGW